MCDSTTQTTEAESNGGQSSLIKPIALVRTKSTPPLPSSRFLPRKGRVDARRPKSTEV